MVVKHSKIKSERILNSIFSILLLIICISLSAQTKLDSLYDVWQDKTQADSTRSKAYKNYIWNGFLYSNPDTAIVLAQALLDYGEEHKYPKAKSMAYNLMGVYNRNKGDYPKALEYYQLSLAINQEIGDKKGSAPVISNIGSTYYNQGDYSKALEYYQRGLNIYQEIGEQKGISHVIGNIGSIYHNQGDYPKALEYYLRSLKVNQEIGNNKGIAFTMGSIGTIYQAQGDNTTALDYYQRSLKIREEIGDKRGIAFIMVNIGNIYKVEDDNTKALDYYQRSLKIYQKIGDKNGNAHVIGNIGEIFEKHKDYTKALEYFQLSLKIREEIGDKRGISYTMGSIGNIYQAQANYFKAVEYCEKALRISKDIGILKEEKNACQCLYDTYKGMNKGNEALIYLEKIQVIDDSLYSQETKKKLQQMELSKQIFTDSIATVEKERLVQEAHQEEVRKKNQIKNIAFIGGAFVLLIAVGLYSRLRFVRKSKASLQIEKDRSDNLLLNILPEEIAQELKLKGKSEAQDFDLVSILFTDFKGFTEASAKMTASLLVGEINACFEAFDGIIEKYKVEKIKTIGDSYMAAGGLPSPTENSIRNTVMAALDMQAFITKRKSENEAKNKPAFEMRVGIHTGSVVAGIVGVKKFQYDIWGDSVNTASRMETNGEVGKVNISQSTYEIIKNEPDLVCVSRGKIEAKGKGEIDMYFVEKRD
jgi:class 3 adenylate cyclase/Tfp pilus assembly protein PilF